MQRLDSILSKFHEVKNDLQNLVKENNKEANITKFMGGK